VAFNFTCTVDLDCLWIARVHWKYYDSAANQPIPYTEIKLSAQQTGVRHSIGGNFEFVVPGTWDKLEIIA